MLTGIVNWNYFIKAIRELAFKDCLKITSFSKTLTNAEDI